jgi:hypothetical protein
MRRRGATYGLLEDAKLRALAKRNVMIHQRQSIYKKKDWEYRQGKHQRYKAKK